MMCRATPADATIAGMTDGNFLEHDPALPLEEFAELIDLEAEAHRAGRGPTSWPASLDLHRRTDPVRWLGCLASWERGWASEDILLRASGESRSP
jgi:hypothetical protein